MGVASATARASRSLAHRGGDRLSAAIRGAGRHRHADHHVDEVAAGHDAVDADEEKPGDDAVGQDAHRRLVRMTAVWSRNSDARIAKPPATSTPTTRFSSGMVPPAIRFPVTPRPTTLLRNTSPASRPSSPMTT